MILSGLQQDQGAGLLCYNTCQASPLGKIRIFGARIKNDPSRPQRKDGIVVGLLKGRIKIKSDRIDRPIQRDSGHDRNILYLPALFSYGIHRVMLLS